MFYDHQMFYFLKNIWWIILKDLVNYGFFPDASLSSHRLEIDSPSLTPA